MSHSLKTVKKTLKQILQRVCGGCGCPNKAVKKGRLKKKI